jgi:hypothetical protein
MPTFKFGGNYNLNRGINEVNSGRFDLRIVIPLDFIRTVVDVFAILLTDLFCFFLFRIESSRTAFQKLR